MESTPPKLPIRFLRFFCPPELVEGIESDLVEQFEMNVKEVGEKKANRRLLWNVIRFCRPGIVLRNRFSIGLNQGGMIQNYFTVLLRNIYKHKSYSAINILCLTLGITFSLLIGTFINQELQVNKNLKDVGRLYLVQSKLKTNNYSDIFAASILPRQCIELYPNVFESYYRFWDRNITVSKSDKHFRLQSMIGDASFIDIFGFKVLSGNGTSVLTNPNSIVITKKIAMQFFNTWDVAGQTLTVSTEQNGKQEYIITAVIEDVEDKNSVTDFMNMDAQVFLSLKNAKDFFPNFDQDSWDTSIISYIKLANNVSANDAENIINKIFIDHAPKKNSEGRTHSLNPIESYYLTTNNGVVQKLVASLMVVIVFILLLAISNFINISISSSFSRSKEIGVRKVMGGLRKQVVIQFLLESFVFAISAGVLAVLAYELTHHYFGELLGANLPSARYFDVNFWFAIAACIFLVGLCAGIYPAIFQSSTNTIDSLKGKFKSIYGTMRFSRVLIGIQFLITVFVLIASVVVSQQTSYFINKDLGYNKSQVLAVSSVPRLWNESGFQKMEYAKKEFLQSSLVQAVSLSWGAPGFNFSPGGGKLYKAAGTADSGVDYEVTGADENYLDVYNLKLVEGSNFNVDGSQRPNEVIINRTAQKALGLQIGDHIKATNFNSAVLIVRGIVQDFNFASLYEKVGPLMIVHNKDFGAYRYFNFKLKNGNASESASEVEKLWKNVFPDEPFVFTFVDDALKNLYTAELQLKKASLVASILMLVIVVTGIFGLVSLSVSKRVKEIGIRKVLGASAASIIRLLGKEYIILLAISFAISIPLAYHLTNQWLNGFAYHVELTWWMFALPLAFLLGTTILVVSAKSLKAALANPSKSIKYE